MSSRPLERTTDPQNEAPSPCPSDACAIAVLFHPEIMLPPRAHIPRPPDEPVETRSVES
jgi:hypothetical protein